MTALGLASMYSSGRAGMQYGSGRSGALMAMGDEALTAFGRGGTDSSWRVKSIAGSDVAGSQ